jgi:hypothetical protein
LIHDGKPRLQALADAYRDVVFLPLIPASGLFAGSRSSQRALRRLQRVLVCSAAFLIEIKQHLFRLI